MQKQPELCVKPVRTHHNNIKKRSKLHICSIKSDSFMIKYLRIYEMMCGCLKICLLLFLLVVGVLHQAFVF